MIHTNGSQPRVETPRLSHWERWQAYHIAQHTLPPAAAAEGFTVVKVPPTMRAMFFDVLRLIIARSRLEARLTAVLAQQDPATLAAVHASLAAWTAWQRSTVQLARACERLAQGRQATLPPVPPEVQALATALDDVALDGDEEATL